jgi:hypothetical protein
MIVRRIIREIVTISANPREGRPHFRKERVGWWVCMGFAMGLTGLLWQASPYLPSNYGNHPNNMPNLEKI